MVRPLLQLAEADRTAGVLLLLAAAATAVASVVVALCTSNRNDKPRKQLRGSSSPPVPQHEEQGGGGGKKQLLASLSGKAAALAKTVSWNRRSPALPQPPGADRSSGGRASDYDGDDRKVAAEEALWKKTIIIMGDKYRPLGFSGRIDYDSDGKRVPPPTSSAESINNDSGTAHAGDR